MIPASLKNIDSLPTSIQPVTKEFANKFLEKFLENTVSICVYGSASGVNYNPSVSNINIAVIVKTLDFSLLSQAVDLVKWGRKNRIATPLFLTKQYIMDSLDVFPVEFSEIKKQHKLIFGEEIFKDLIIPSRDVRLLCEQQVKGKLLHLRQAYLEIGSNPSLLKNLLSAALSDLIPIYRQLILLNGQEPMDHKEEMLGQLAMIFNLDIQPFLLVYNDKNKKAVIASGQVETHFQNFLIQLELLSRHLDSL